MSWLNLLGYQYLALKLATRGLNSPIQNATAISRGEEVQGCPVKRSVHELQDTFDVGLLPANGGQELLVEVGCRRWYSDDDEEAVESLVKAGSPHLRSTYPKSSVPRMTEATTRPT